MKKLSLMLLLFAALVMAGQAASAADRIVVSTDMQLVRFLLVSGKPLGEPVAWYGPIVMNTREELRVAFDEYRAGTFIKHKQT